MQAAQAPRRALHAARCLLNQGAAKTVTITIDGQEAQVWLPTNKLNTITDLSALYQSFRSVQAILAVTATALTVQVLRQALITFIVYNSINLPVITVFTTSC